MTTISRQFHQLCGSANHDLWRSLLLTDFPFPLPSPSNPYQSYLDHHQLARRWRAGKAKTSYLTGHQDSVYCVVWIGPHRIVSGSRDRTIKVWDLQKKGGCIQTEQQHQGSVLCLYATEHFMVSGSSDTTCGVLDLCVVGDWIISSSRDSTIRVWHQKEGRELRQLVGHTGPVNALEAHGSRVVSASGDMTLKLWDVATGQCLRTFVGHTKGLACVKFDGTSIYSGAQDGIRVWDVESGSCHVTLGGHTDLIRTIDCFGDKIVSGSYDRTLRVWDAKTGECLMRCQSGHSSWIFNVLISRTRIVSASQDKPWTVYAAPLQDSSVTSVDLSESPINGKGDEHLYVTVTRVDDLMDDDGSILAERVMAVQVTFDVIENELHCNGVPVQIGVSNIQVEAQVAANPAKITIASEEDAALLQDSFDIGLATVEVTAAIVEEHKTEDGMSFRRISVQEKITEINGKEVVQTEAGQQLLDVFENGSTYKWSVDPLTGFLLPESTGSNDALLASDEQTTGCAGAFLVEPLLGWWHSQNTVVHFGVMTVVFSLLLGIIYFVRQLVAIGEYEPVSTEHDTKPVDEVIWEEKKAAPPAEEEKRPFLTQ
ncbi:hypothetical protein DFQ30_006133 [Apophysomyces sp. BC1015]|nr:hypothetical protein DFQ30_006133 [Apophysomyces sp. BC1015]